MTPLSAPSEDMGKALEEVRKEVKELKRDLYGNPQVRQKGVFDRLESLEEKLTDMRSQYERERVEQESFNRLETELDQLSLNYRVAIVYLRGIAAAVGTITVTLIAAAVVGILRLVSGGG